MSNMTNVDDDFQKYLVYGRKDSRDEDEIQCADVREEFKEITVVNQLIDNIPNACQTQISFEYDYYKFIYIIDNYQEQPHLLDPHLEAMLERLLACVRNKDTDMGIKHMAFKYIYIITKARGHKIVVRLMPHEVADLEPVLALLAQQNPTDFGNWETRYVLLLWLSIVSMIPFDMVRLDSNLRTQTGETKKPIMDRIIEAGQGYLWLSDKTRDAAAYMLSRFMTRPDVKKEKLPSFLDWCLQSLHNADRETMPGMSAIAGTLTVLALLFKHSKREDILDYGPTILERVNALKLNESSNTVLRKLHTKLVQRLGLTFLKARVAAWRYQRGNRSLVDNLSLTTPKSIEACNITLESPEEEEDYEIPDEIEEIVEHLLIGLKDKDTIVRWSAAKGIGRVTGRLPKELADEVVESLMRLFTITETDAAWHGGCLALAELGRRGLLVPERLPAVVPVILKALAYDEKRGNFSVGAHVRDAACYVCWAFARAYEPQDLKPYINNIANALVVVSVFDREVNVRRAAAAAFQEHVGRQGQFPHGIDILTTCDYFAVGNRTNCYLELSVYVAEFPEYTRALIDHLVDIKINHWDIQMRELASQALHCLTPKDPEYMAKKVLPKLLKFSTSMEMTLRHGAITAAAEVTHALSLLADSKQQKIGQMIDSQVMDGLKAVAEKLQNAELFKGVGGEYMRKAVCCLIEKLSVAGMPFHGDPVLNVWQDIIQDCLQHIEPEIQGAAIKAIPGFYTQYYKSSSGLPDQAIQKKVVEKFLSQLKSPTETVRMGYSLAIGAFPQFFLTGMFDTILSSLIQASVITDKEQTWAEARRDAVKAIGSMCVTAGVQLDGPANCCMCKENVADIYDALFNALKDYTLDSRGDVGAWVREASMQALCDITSFLVTKEPSLVPPNVVKELFCHLAQQASEKIDRTRACAGSVFSTLLYHDPSLSGIPHVQDLQEILPRDSVGRINWAAPADSFPLMTRLLDLEAYRYHTLLGLTVSAGGLTESLVKHSSTSLLTYLKLNTQTVEKLDKFSTILLQIFRDYQKVDRVTLPMFKMLDLLLSNECFELYAEEVNHTFPLELLSLSRQEISKCGEPQKLLCSIDLFCGLLQFSGDVKKKTLSQLLIFLCHRYPIVRRTTASKLYEASLTYNEVIEDEAVDEVTSILSDTQWDEPVEVVRPLRNKLCDLLGVPKPVLKSATKSAQGAGDA